MFDVLYRAAGAKAGQKRTPECGRDWKTVEDEGVREQGERLGGSRGESRRVVVEASFFHQRRPWLNQVPCFIRRDEGFADGKLLRWRRVRVEGTLPKRIRGGLCTGSTRGPCPRGRTPKAVEVER